MIELKKTFLTAVQRAPGAKRVDFGNWDMPAQYRAGITPERRTVRRKAGLFDEIRGQACGAKMVPTPFYKRSR